MQTHWARFASYTGHLYRDAIERRAGMSGGGDRPLLRGKPSAAQAHHPRVELHHLRHESSIPRLGRRGESFRWLEDRRALVRCWTCCGTRTSSPVHASDDRVQGPPVRREGRAPCRPRRFSDCRSATEQPVTSARAGRPRGDLPRHYGRGCVMRTRASTRCAGGRLPTQAVPTQAVAGRTVRPGRESRAQAMTALRQGEGLTGKSMAKHG